VKKIHILFPSAAEAQFFRAPKGIEVHICGIGMAECATETAHAIATQHPDLLILAGIAGTYSDEFAMGETVVVESEIIADLGRVDNANDRENSRFVPLFQKKYNVPGPFPEGFRRVRSNSVNAAGNPMTPHDSADIENMEGAAFFAVCQRFNVAALEVRTISNRVGEPVTAEKLELSAKSLANALEKIVNSL
jgi:nucleoside phosphorylase